MLLIQLWRKADCRPGPFLDFKEEPTSFKIIQIFTISKFPREKHVSLCIKVTDLSSSAGPDDLGNLSNCLNSLNREKSFKISWGLNELHCKKYLAHNICSINFLLLSWFKKKKNLSILISHSNANQTFLGALFIWEGQGSGTHEQASLHPASLRGRGGRVIRDLLY